MIQLIGKRIDQHTAENIIIRLYEEQIITKRECTIMISVMDRSNYHSSTVHRDEVRANMLKSMINCLKYKESN